MVEDDTNTVLADAVAAVKLGVKVGHVEAGLRSYDRRMPKETNRVLADHCATYLFAPTPRSREILLHEGIGEKQVFMVGNTIVDAVYQNLNLAKSKTQILDQLNLKANKYILATTHRQENVDDPAKLKRILQAIQKTEMPIIFPIHPRTKKG